MDAKVSVIVPLYNAEKYIAECLDSLLAQTFTDFEIIVVDDCSTDSSAAIVESYREKFGGRLTFTRLKKNSGNAGYSARNRGFNCSRGEYVFFVDADDTLTKTALEQLYTVAKKFDADVVYTGARYFYTTTAGATLKIDEYGTALKKNALEDRPILIADSPKKVLDIYLVNFGMFHTGMYNTPWTKFVKRDFLATEGITFYEILSSGDLLWTIELFACAKRFVRIPDALYFYRNDAVDSMTRVQKSDAAQIAKWSKIFVQWSQCLLKLNDKLDILKQHPEYAYSALAFHFYMCLKRNNEARMHVNPQTIYNVLRGKFGNDVELIIPFLFSMIDLQQKNSAATLRRFNQFASAANKRIAQLEAEVKRLQS